MQKRKNILRTNNTSSQNFTKNQMHLLQQTCGNNLYYAKAIDNAIIHALNDLAIQVIKGKIKITVQLIQIQP